MSARQAGLRYHLNRVSHVVINVSDLERSRALYEASSPLRLVARFDAPAQPMPALGLASGSFEGCVLRDATEGHPCEIHLVRWRDPAPIGSPYADFFNLGYFRLSFKSTQVQQRYEDAVQAGGRPFTEPLPPRPGHNYGRPVFGYRDPDGTVLEYVTMPGVERLYHVNFNCADILRTRAFLEDTLGLTCWLRATSDIPEKNSFSADSGLSFYDAAMFKVGGGDASREQPMFTLDVVQWRQPTPVGVPYPSQQNLGIVRVALEVHHLDEAYELLQTTPGVSMPGAPSTVDLGSDLGRRRHLLLTTPDAMVIELVEQPGYPEAA
jgi:catechol 2,3-dioxygenase-like lactoylglutathione lyase family enzyme